MEFVFKKMRRERERERKREREKKKDAIFKNYSCLFFFLKDTVTLLWFFQRSASEVCNFGIFHLIKGNSI